MKINKQTELGNFNGTIEEFNDSSLPAKGWAVYVEPTPEPVPPYVPFSISMRQCQLYLYAMDEGVTLNTITNYVLTLSIPAQIEWNTSADVWRSSPMVEQMRLMFGWTVEQMDQMFVTAEQL